MLWFNVLENFSAVCMVEFQYILCYGSTVTNPKKFENLTEFQYILCYGSTIAGM